MYSGGGQALAILKKFEDLKKEIKQNKDYVDDKFTSKKFWQPKNVKNYNPSRCWYVKNGNLLTIQFQIDTYAYDEAEIHLAGNSKETFEISSVSPAFTTCFGLGVGSFVIGLRDEGALYIQPISEDTKWQDGTRIYGQINTYFT